MKKISLILLAFIILFNNSCKSPKENFSSKKYQHIETKYTEIKQIVSAEVDDTFYVYIRLPKNYNESNKRFPVLYLLDGDISFNMATSVVRYLQFDKSVPDLIIVAPAYGTMMNDDEQNYRERDYTFSDFKNANESGGGYNYSNFLMTELIPTIDSSYRTNGKRILNGYSLGGLFVLNTLIESTNKFQYFIAGSPYLENDIQRLTDQVENMTISQVVKKLFVSVGELEDKKTYHNQIKTLTSQLEKIDGLEIKFVEFNNGTHFTCPSEALTYGLKYIFEK